MYDQALNDEALQRHNELRKRHGVPPLTFDPNLATKAQKYAEKLARMKMMEHASHEESEGAGENLAMTGGMPLTGAASTDMWYDEIKDYDFSNPGFGMNTGHFTQVVWKGSQKFGFGLGQNGSSYYGVGRYYPPGNMMGDFPNNVPPLGSEESPASKPKGKENKPTKTKRVRNDSSDENVIKLKNSKIKLSQEEVQAIISSFNECSYETGNMPVSSVIDVLRECGQNPSAAKIKELAMSMDVNDDGYVSMDELIQFLEETYQDSNSMADSLRQAFAAFDTNGDGYMDKDELYEALTTMGNDQMTQEQVDDLMAMGDLDGDGRLDVDEYVKLFCGQ